MKTESSATAQADIWEELGQQVKGTILMPDTDGYTEECSIWNGAVKACPTAIIFCEDSADVQNAIKVAKRHGMPVSIRAGGHDSEGKSVRDYSVVLDVSRMNDISIDPETKLATVGGGTLTGDLVRKAEKYGLVPVTGNTSSVGLVGFSLGGGYSPLSGQFGIGADNLVSAEVVLWDGSIVTANSESHPDLFWALRGGGSNFGVITRLTIRVHSCKEVFAGAIIFPLDQAVTVLRNYREFMRECPDELGLMAVFLAGPGGQIVLALLPTWSGEILDARPVFTKIAQFGTPIVNEAGPQPLFETFRMADSHVIKGQHTSYGNRLLSELDDAAIAVLVEAAQGITSAHSAVLLYDFHGAATRIAPDATAFALRDQHFLAQFSAAWEDESDGGETHRTWANQFSSALAPYSLPGGYVNFLKSTDEDRVRQFYSHNVDRLLAIKDKYDPQHTFLGSGNLRTRSA